jgi:hypothetical protein
MVASSMLEAAWTIGFGLTVSRDGREIFPMRTLAPVRAAAALAPYRNSLLESLGCFCAGSSWVSVSVKNIPSGGLDFPAKIHVLNF